jgi:hypothetical protein
METQVKEILALEEGVSVNKKELSKEDATKLLALAGNSSAQPGELIHLLDTIDQLANAGRCQPKLLAHLKLTPLIITSPLDRPISSQSHLPISALI